MKNKTEKPKRDLKTGRYIRNRWDSPEAIKRKDFHKGYAGLGSPAEAFEETDWCQYLSESWNFLYQREKGIRSIHHARIDDKGLKVPDISFRELPLDRTAPSLAVLEVDTKKGLTGKDGAKAKAKKAVDKYGAKEAFVYVIDKREWLKYTPSTGWNKTGTSRSKVLGIDLQDINPHFNEPPY